MALKIEFDNNGKTLLARAGQVALVAAAALLFLYALVRWGESLRIVILNFAVALPGMLLAIEGMIYGFRRLDRLTDFDTSQKLADGNIAVGLTVAGLFVGIGLVVGLVMALGVN